MMREEPLLKLDRVSMYYHGNNSVIPGIVDVSLEFRRGEFVVITGESGAGKSSLLQVIGALRTYHGGEMYYMGESTSYFDEDDLERYRRENVSYIFQDYSLIYSYTALQNVASALLLRGMKYKKACVQAMAYLKRVGLEECALRRASKLSSGQKQRLAIARALAKESGIIIADEPTGNLDSENGAAVIDLLADISRDRLVIMVSHNIEEAQRKATRRIKMSEGHVVSDMQLRSPAHTSAHTQRPACAKGCPQLSLAALNVRSQGKKALLIWAVMSAVLLSCGVFMGVFVANTDDTPARVYDPSAFANGDERRVVVRRIDGQAMSEEDELFARAVAYVQSVELYDNVADVNYYIDYDRDYYYKYTTVEKKVGAEVVASMRKKNALLLRDTKYMRTASCLSKDDLLCGTLPEKACEVALYGTEEDLGREVTIIIADRDAWGLGEHVELTYKVSGVLRANDEQIYFSGNAARTLLACEQQLRLDYARVDEKNTRSNTLVTPIIAVDDTLADGEMVLSTEAFNMDEGSAGEAVLGRYDGAEGWMDRSFRVSGTKYSTKRVAKISQSAFDSLFGECLSKQMSVYIKDYAYVAQVVQSFQDAGYRAISPFKACALTFDKAKVAARAATMLICAVAFIAAQALGVLLVFVILKLRRDDYAVLHAIGMTRREAWQMICMELAFYAGAPLVFCALAAAGLYLANIRAVYDVMKYMRWYHYLGLVLTQVIWTSVLCLKSSLYMRAELLGQSKRSAGI